jgi:4-amino-4-deoxy-L-arabinose transferase-like glycosyltransferase
MSTLRKKACLLFVLFLLLAFLGQGLWFISTNSQTFDEGVHLTAGYSYWATGDFRLNPEHPPLIKELCALPVFLYYRLPFHPDAALWDEARAGEDRAQWLVSRDFLYHGGAPGPALIALGRVPNLLLGLGLVALIGWWAYRLWGTGAALLGMSVAAFEPNLVANASLITTDLGISLFSLLTFYLLWEYATRPSYRLLLASGLALGLVLVTKFSCLLILILVAASIGSHLLLGGSFTLPGVARDEQSTFPQRLRQAAAPTLRILFVALLVILPFYAFQGYGSWALGLRTQMNQQTTGKESFFLGDYSEGGWWYYFPVCFVLKTPLGCVALILAALLLGRAGKQLGRQEWLFLVLPVGLYFLALTRLRLNIGLRYALPVYPFLLVLASRLATIRFRRAWLAPVALSFAVACSAASALRSAPHQLAYFNELAGGPEAGHRLLSNSNIDWGQGLSDLKSYLDREGVGMVRLAYYGTAEPESYGIRAQYVPGFGQLGAPPTEVVPAGQRELLAISVVNLQGVHCANRDLYAWLRKRTPVATPGYSLFVYDLTGDAEAHLHLAKVYLEVGPPALAEAELRAVLALDPIHPEALRLLGALAALPISQACTAALQ